jgi:hypothetical protein
MQSGEYRVKLTVAGRIRVWEEAMWEYTRALSAAERALVSGAAAIADYPRADGSEEYLTDLSQAWWEDYKALPMGKQFVVSTRLVRLGVTLPQQFVEVNE